MRGGGYSCVLGLTQRKAVPPVRQCLKATTCFRETGQPESVDNDQQPVTIVR